MRSLAGLVALVVLSPFAACGGADDAQAPAPGPAATSPAVAQTPADLGGAAVVALSAEEICRAVPVADASRALRTEVAQATPSGAATPQCTYSYGGDSASLSTFTIAAQRPTDVGDRTLQAAFDHVVELNGEPGQEPGEQNDVDAGDRAVRLTGEALSLVVLAVEGHLLTITTMPDLDGSAVDELARVVASGVAA